MSLSSPERQSPCDASRILETVNVDALSDAELQTLFAAAVSNFAKRAVAHNLSSPFPVKHGRCEVPATDVMIAVTKMLKAVQVEVFELGMWQAWTGGNCEQPRER